MRRRVAGYKADLRVLGVKMEMVEESDLLRDGVATERASSQYEVR